MWVVKFVSKLLMENLSSKTPEENGLRKSLKYVTDDFDHLELDVSEKLMRSTRLLYIDQDVV